MYKDTWDALEKKNLDNDVKLYLQHGDFDRLYRDHYITRDELRLEEIIEKLEEIATEKFLLIQNKNIPQNIYR